MALTYPKNPEGGGGTAVGSTTPANLGTAAAGTSEDAARADHVHAVPARIAPLTFDSTEYDVALLPALGFQCYGGGSPAVYRFVAGAATPAGTLTALTTADGLGISCRSSANAQVGLASPSIPYYSGASRFRFRIRVGVPAAITDQRMFVGYSNSSVSAGADTPTNNNYALVGFRSGASDTTWDLLTRDSSATTEVATGWTAVAASDLWDFDFEHNGPAGSVRVRARRKASGGSWGAWLPWVSATGNLPSTSVNYAEVAVGQGTNSTSRGIDLYHSVGGLVV